MQHLDVEQWWWQRIGDPDRRKNEKNFREFYCSFKNYRRTDGTEREVEENGAALVDQERQNKLYNKDQRKTKE